MNLVTINNQEYISQKLKTYPTSYVAWDKSQSVKFIADLLSFFVINNQLYGKFSISGDDVSKLKSSKLYFALKREAFSFLGHIHSFEGNYVIVKINKCVIEEQRKFSRRELYEKSYFGHFNHEIHGKKDFNFKINDISDSGISFLVTKEFSISLFEQNNSSPLILHSIQNNKFSKSIELTPVYAKHIVTKDQISVYKIGARFNKSSQEVKKFIKKILN